MIKNSLTPTKKKKQKNNHVSTKLTLKDKKDSVAFYNFLKENELKSLDKAYICGETEYWQGKLTACCCV